MSARRLLGLAGGFDCLELELERGLARRDALAMLSRRDVYKGQAFAFPHRAGGLPRRAPGRRPLMRDVIAAV